MSDTLTPSQPVVEAAPAAVESPRRRFLRRFRGRRAAVAAAVFLALITVLGLAA
ncbi:MAG: diguanylate cyclase, partial [Acidobacteria bacterium]